ncbi:hypothetical protein [Actinacidiphila glaucinigra]
MPIKWVASMHSRHPLFVYGAIRPPPLPSRVGLARAIIPEDDSTGTSAGW